MDLARLENKLLFCFDSEIEKKLNEFNTSFNVPKSISALDSAKQTEAETAGEKNCLLVCYKRLRGIKNCENGFYRVRKRLQTSNKTG